MKLANSWTLVLMEGFMKLAEVVVYVHDFPRALAYYRDTLGLPVLFSHEDKEHGIARVNAGGTSILIHQMPANESLPPPLPSFVADDLNSEWAALNAKGAGIGAISDQGWGRIAHFTDPDGNRLCIYKEAGH